MSEAARRRVGVDVARGLAVLAMFAFHFVWDLGHFGYIDSAFGYSPGFKAFGHVIAASFLFIVGVSLVLAHERRFRARDFWRRSAIVTAAALLVSGATYLMFPEAFVFFGILHCIAAASLLALPFLFLPWPAALVAATAMFVAPIVARNAMFDAPLWWWTGLSTFEPMTNDYQPFLPWAGVTLAGVGFAKLLYARSFVAGAMARPGKAAGGLSFLGRHSLILYLAHQPLFFAGFAAVAMAVQPAEPIMSFEDACRVQCLASGGQDDACLTACACTAREVVRQDALAGATDESERRSRIDAIARACVAAKE